MRCNPGKQESSQESQINREYVQDNLPYILGGQNPKTQINILTSNRGTKLSSFIEHSRLINAASNNRQSPFSGAATEIDSKRKRQIHPRKHPRHLEPCST